MKMWCENSVNFFPFILSYLRYGFSLNVEILLGFRFEGWMGFYKGIVPNLLRVVPATSITFVVYENVSSYLAKKRKDQPNKSMVKTFIHFTCLVLRFKLDEKKNLSSFSCFFLPYIFTLTRTSSSLNSFLSYFALVALSRGTSFHTVFL